jgi:hypothetical protein
MRPSDGVMREGKPGERKMGTFKLAVCPLRSIFACNFKNITFYYTQKSNQTFADSPN